jgi:hypothetical protein
MTAAWIRPGLSGTLASKLKRELTEQARPKIQIFAKGVRRAAA